MTDARAVAVCNSSRTNKIFTQGIRQQNCRWFYYHKTITSKAKLWVILLWNRSTGCFSRTSETSIKFLHWQDKWDIQILSSRIARLLLSPIIHLLWTYVPTHQSIQGFDRMCFQAKQCRYTWKMIPFCHVGESVKTGLWLLALINLKPKQRNTN